MRKYLKRLVVKEVCAEYFLTLSSSQMVRGKFGFFQEGKTKFNWQLNIIQFNACCVQCDELGCTPYPNHQSRFSGQALLSSWVRVSADLPHQVKLGSGDVVYRFVTKDKYVWLCTRKCAFSFCKIAFYKTAVFFLLKKVHMLLFEEEEEETFLEITLLLCVEQHQHQQSPHWLHQHCRRYSIHTDWQAYLIFSTHYRVD